MAVMGMVLCRADALQVVCQCAIAGQVNPVEFRCGKITVVALVNISKGVQLANVICQKIDVGSRNAGYFVKQDNISKNDLFPGNAVFFQGGNPLGRVNAGRD